MRSEEADLLSDIYGAALHAHLWPEILHRLGALAGGIGGALMLWDRHASAPLLFLESGHLGPDTDEVYRTRYAAADPQLALLGEAEPGRWILLTRRPDAAVLRSAFYQEFLRPRGIRHVIGALLAETDELRAYVCLHRGQGQTEFCPSAVETLAGLGPHLQRAAEIFCRVTAMRLEHTAGRAILDSASLGITLVDESSRLLYANPAALSLLAEADGLQLRQGRLEASRNFERSRLGKLVGQAVATSARDAMLIGRTSGSPLGVYVLPAGEAQIPHGLAPQSTVLVLLSDLMRPTSWSAPRLRSLFGLTEAEAVVAQEIMNGTRVERIAAARGTSVATVRTQVRSLLDKTGANGLGELVRILNGLPRLNAD